MDFAPFGYPLQSFVCFLVPSYDLKKSLKPLQHNERQNKQTNKNKTKQNQNKTKIEILISRKSRPSV